MRSVIPLFALVFAVSAPALAVEVVPVTPFRAVELRGGGDVALVPGPAQRVTLLDGSTQFTRFRIERGGKLVIDACNDRCPRNYHLRIQIENPRVPTVAVTGGGTIHSAPGFAPQSDLTAAVMGGGEIDLRGMDATSVTAAVNGGGTISVQPRSALTAAINGGGEIIYWGNPALTSAVQGGGEVRRGN